MVKKVELEEDETRLETYKKYLRIVKLQPFFKSARMKNRKIKLFSGGRGTSSENKLLIQRALRLLRAPLSSAWIAAQKDCADILSMHQQTTLIARLFSEQEVRVRALIHESQLAILSHFTSSIERIQVRGLTMPQISIEDSANAVKPAEPQVVSSLTPPSHIPPQNNNDNEEDEESMIYGQVQLPTQVPLTPLPVDMPLSPMSPQVAPQTLRRLIRVADKIVDKPEIEDNTEAIPSSSLEELLKDEEASMVAQERQEELDADYDNDVESRDRASVFTQAYQSQAEKPQRRLPHTMLPTKSIKERSLRGITLAKRSSMKRNQVEEEDNHQLVHGEDVNKDIPFPSVKRPKRTLYITDEPSAPDDTPMREAKTVLKAQQDHDIVMSITSFPTAASGADFTTTATAAAMGNQGVNKGGRNLFRGRPIQEEEVEGVNAVEFSAVVPDIDTHHQAKRTTTATSKFQAFQEQARMAVSAAAARFVPPPPTTSSKKSVKKGLSSIHQQQQKTPIEKSSAAQERAANITAHKVHQKAASAQQSRTTAPFAPPPPRTMPFTTSSKRQRPGPGRVGFGNVPSLVSNAFSAKDARPLFEALRGDPLPTAPLPSVPRFKPGFNVLKAPAAHPPLPVRMADGRIAIVAGPVAEILSGTTGSVDAAGVGGVGGSGGGGRGVGGTESVRSSSLLAKVQSVNEGGKEPEVQDHVIGSASTAIPEAYEEESLIDSGVIAAAMLLDGAIQWQGEEEGGGGGGGGDDLGRLSMPNNPGRSTAIAAAGLAWMMGADDEKLSAEGASQRIPPELMAAIYEDHRNISGRASLQLMEELSQGDDLFSPDVGGYEGANLNDSDFVSESEANNIDREIEEDEEIDSFPPLRIQVDPGDEDIEPLLNIVVKQQMISKSQGSSGVGAAGGKGGVISFSAEDLIED